MSTSARTLTGDLALPRVVVTDLPSVVQQTIIDGFNLWKGEWFLDLNVGFPWFQEVLGRKIVSTSQVESLLRDFLLSVPGVATVQASSTFNRKARSFAYAFTATLNEGTVITGGSGLPTAIQGTPAPGGS